VHPVELSISNRFRDISGGNRSAPDEVGDGACEFQHEVIGARRQLEPLTLGEHVSKRRLELRLTQKQAAKRPGTNPRMVLNREKNHTNRPIESMPAIIRFLGHDSFFAKPKNIPERLLAKRRRMGWSMFAGSG
jgi:hypothetical protein